jgi:hypothetical protein
MEWKLRADDEELTAPDTATLKKWVGEGRVLPEHCAFHPVLQEWMYLSDIQEVGWEDEDDTPNHVVVTDLDMPLGSMVNFMVKWAIASIPAFLILILIGGFIWVILGGLFHIRP